MKRIDVITLVTMALSEAAAYETDAEQVQARQPSDPSGSDDVAALVEDQRAALRKAMAAFIEKQREPETATFRAARHKKDSQVTFIRYDLPTQLGVSYEWLDHDGKPQTFEVKV